MGYTLLGIGINKASALNGGNYIDNTTSQGNIIRWQAYSKPIKVYIEPANSIINPKLYVNCIKNGLKSWSNASHGKVKFLLVQSPKNANIIINWDKYKPSLAKKNNLYYIGFTEPNYTENQLISMNIRFNTWSQSGKTTPVNLFEKGVTHELGHALGIMGHSPNKKDIMYPFISLTTNRLSQRDINTINLLYQSEPDISNFPKASSEGQEIDKNSLIQTYNSSKEARFKKELARLKQEIIQYPGAFLSYNNLGSAYEQNGTLDLAIDCYKKAISINPKFDDAYINLGEAYRKMKLYDLAIENLKKALDINPSSAYAYNNLGNLYYKKNEYDLAIDNYKKAISIKPDLTCAYSNLNLVYAKKAKAMQN